MPPCAKFALSPCALIQATKSFGLSPGIDLRPIRTIGALLTRPTGSNAVFVSYRRLVNRLGAAGNAIIGQRAAASDHVLDDDGLAERARHPLADEACHSIRAAAGRIGNHQH